MTAHSFSEVVLNDSETEGKQDEVLKSNVRGRDNNSESAAMELNRLDVGFCGL